MRAEIGDVIKLYDGLHIVDMVNESRARCIPMTIQSVTFTTTAEREVKFNVFGNYVSVSPNLEPEAIIEHRGQAGLTEFLKSKATRFEEKQKETRSRDERKPMKSKKMLNGVPLPNYVYYAVIWEECYKGGTEQEIAERSAQRLVKEYPRPQWSWWGDVATALKWVGPQAALMTSAGLNHRVGQPYVASAVDAAQAQPSPGAATPTPPSGAAETKPEAPPATIAPKAKGKGKKASAFPATDKHVEAAVKPVRKSKRSKAPEPKAEAA